MQFTTILASTILAFASGISAAPAVAAQFAGGSVTLRIFNDQAGISTDLIVPADNTPRYLQDLLKGTAIGASNVATSAQLINAQDSTKCLFQTTRKYDWTVPIDGESHNFVDLDGDVTKAVPVWVGDFTFQCSSA